MKKTGDSEGYFDIIGGKGGMILIQKRGYGVRKKRKENGNEAEETFVRDFGICVHG